MPNVRELSERIELRHLTEVPEASGGSAVTYVKLAEVWAKIEAVSGTLYFGLQQTEKTVTHAVTIRGFPNWRQVEYVLWLKSGRRMRVERARDLDVAPVFQEFLCEEIKTSV